MKKLIFSLTVALIAAGCERNYTSPASSTGNLHQNNVAYNPEDCKTDAEGMVYFALGREVFRRPYEEAMSIRGMPEEDKKSLPPRPDPSEPEGCPDNPIWGSNFSLNYRHQPRHPESYPPGTSFSVEQLNIIAIPDRDKGTSVEFGLQPSLEKDFYRVKEEYKTCEPLKNGLLACFVPDETPKNRWTVKFKADANIYTAPFGRPFVVSCVSWTAGFVECNASYNYTENIRISYRFRLASLPALEIIEYDKGVRDKIESMRVNDYLWESN